MLEVFSLPTTLAELGTVLPSVNAFFNALSACLLVVGRVAIARRNVRAHMVAMVAAFGSSGLFLLGYLTRMALTGTHRFPGTGAVRNFYLGLLFSHMVLAVVLVPMVLWTLHLAAHQQFARHRRLAAWTWPIWQYVSVTGVVVYYMLYHLAPAT